MKVVQWIAKRCTKKCDCCTAYSCRLNVFLGWASIQASPCLMKTFHSLMTWHVSKNSYSPQGQHQAFWKVDQHCLKPVRSLFFAVEAQEPSPLFPTRVQSKINIIYLVWICACVHFNLLHVGRRLFFQFLQRFVFGFQMSLANELISASCVTASIKLIKTM